MTDIKTWHCSRGHVNTSRNSDGTCQTQRCAQVAIPDVRLGQFEKNVEHPVRGETISFRCSLHGEQAFRCFSFASIVLACGCMWQAHGVVTELVPVEFYGYWRDGDRTSQSIYRRAMFTDVRGEVPQRKRA